MSSAVMKVTKKDIGERYLTIREEDEYYEDFTQKRRPSLLSKDEKT